jgi:hypothetical protein
MSEVVEAAHERLHDQLQRQQQQQRMVESGGLGMTAVTVLTHVLSYLGPLMLQPPAFGPGPLLSPGEKFTPEAVSELHGGWAALVTWLLVAGEKCRWRAPVWISSCMRMQMHLLFCSCGSQVDQFAAHPSDAFCCYSSQPRGRMLL